MGAKDAAVIAELRKRMRAIECASAGLPGHPGAHDRADGEGFVDGCGVDGPTGLTPEEARTGEADGGHGGRGAEGSALDEQAAFRKIERLLNAREHPRAALLQRLSRDGFPDDVAASAVDRAVRCGLVCDERFADVLVRSRLSQGKGLQGIAAELERFEIDPWSVEAYQLAADGGDGPDELARALDVLASKPPRSKRPRDAAFRKLMQKGFGADVSASAARIWFEEHGRREQIA